MQFDFRSHAEYADTKLKMRLLNKEVSTKLNTAGL